MYDRGYVPVDEFAKKLINQGMILGTSAFAARMEGTRLLQMDAMDFYSIV